MNSWNQIVAIAAILGATINGNSLFMPHLQVKRCAKVVKTYHHLDGSFAGRKFEIHPWGNRVEGHEVYEITYTHGDPDAPQVETKMCDFREVIQWLGKVC